MSRIFLSHSSSDLFEAIGIQKWLRSEGWEDVFLDLDEKHGIAPGERWEAALHAAANRCEAVVFLISSNWLKSGWCLKEYNLACRLNKQLFGVVIDPAISIGELPPELSGTWQIVDLAHGQDATIFPARRPGSHEERHVAFSQDGLVRLRRGLQKSGLDPQFFAWPPANDLARNPYRGLKALEAADAGVFFGRDAPIVEATDRLRGLGLGAPPRLFVILGASGAGKSSFLRAGLLPRLARDDRHFLPLPPIRPERAIITGENGLLRSLEIACPTITRADLRTAVNGGASTLREVLCGLSEAAFRKTLLGAATSRPPAIVIAIDQAEELFRIDGSFEATQLLNLVREITSSDDPAVIVIFTIRSDSYDALEHAKPLEGLAQATLPLLPLQRGAISAVIEGPARRVVKAGGKLQIEPRLTQRLLEDVDKGGGSDSLPLLAFTLEQLYIEYHRSGVLRVHDYVAIGGLKGAIDAAVARAFIRADSDARIPRDQSARELLLRRGLIPWLAGIDPDTKSPRRNKAKRSDIPVEAAPLIDLIVEERLLLSDISSDESDAEQRKVITLEPAHEALLRQWGLLEDWLEADFGLLVLLEGVKRASRDWRANGRSFAWLSHQASRLEDAQTLRYRPDIAAKLDKDDLSYLGACQRKEITARRRSRFLHFSIYTLMTSIIIGLIGWINQAEILKEYMWVFIMRPYMNSAVRPFVLSSSAESNMRIGQYFRECAGSCPEMVVIPAGKFLMGSPLDEKNRKSNEGDAPHEVSISRRFAVSKFDVTFDDWDACVTVGGCPFYSDAGMGRGRKPMIHVTWNDAQSYAAWFSKMTGANYRLLTEAEWEYAARAGTSTAYYWGSEVESRKADCVGCSSEWDGKETSPVGSFPPNLFGLYDMAGDVWEWVIDCYHSDYRGAPEDGSAWITGGDCNQHIARGGSWNDVALYSRSAARARVTTDDRDGDLGFRLARTLQP